MLLVDRHLLKSLIVFLILVLSCKLCHNAVVDKINGCLYCSVLPLGIFLSQGFRVCYEFSDETRRGVRCLRWARLRPFTILKNIIGYAVSFAPWENRTLTFRIDFGGWSLWWSPTIGLSALDLIARVVVLVSQIWVIHCPYAFKFSLYLNILGKK